MALLLVAFAWFAMAYASQAPQADWDGAQHPSGSASAPAAAADGTPVSTSVVVLPATSTTSGNDAPISDDDAEVAAELVRQGRPGRNMVALTFDDNYQGERSMHTVKILRQHEVPATFFVIGHYTRNGHGLAKALARGGFEIGDHTYSHTDCSAVPEHWLEEEIGGGTAAFREVTGGETAPLFRPPYGHWTDKTLEVAGKKGFRYVVLWSVDTRDWEGRSAAEITETVLTEAVDGSIVVMHPDAAHTHEALPEIIRGLRDKGYRLVTVSELLSES